jgi:hypothetical protein
MRNPDEQDYRSRKSHEIVAFAFVQALAAEIRSQHMVALYHHSGGIKTCRITLIIQIRCPLLRLEQELQVKVHSYEQEEDLNQERQSNFGGLEGGP